MTETNPMSHAERLVRWGSPDERVEAVTGLPLGDILAIRARLATPQRPSRDDYFSGRSWWPVRRMR